MKNLLIILLFFLLPIDVFPQLILNDHLEDYYIDHIEIFQNKNPATPDSAIVSGKMNKYFSVLKNKNHVQLATPFWIKFDIENKSGSNKQWLVEFFDFKINSLIFYSSGNKQNHPSLEGGNQLPFSNKSLAHKNFTFPIQITQGKVKTFYVKIYSQKAISLLIVVRTFDEFVKYALQEYLILGIYYGIILLVILLNLFLYFSSKDKAYIYYIYYVLSIGFFH